MKRHMGKGGPGALMLHKNEENVHLIQSVLDRMSLDGVVKDVVDRGRAFLVFPEEGIQVGELQDMYNKNYKKTHVGVA
jgi:hypothetical protein